MYSTKYLIKIMKNYVDKNCVEKNYVDKLYGWLI